MAISSVRAQVNGTWYTLTYNDATGSYKGTITAPGSTSFNREGGYYDVTIEATNTAGTKTTANGSNLAGLRLRVKETVKPIISISSPSSGAYVTTNTPTIVFSVEDEIGGSGVNINSLSIKLDGEEVGTSEYTTSTITKGYKVTYKPASAVSDGTHTVIINCADNDGNNATQGQTTFVVDTVPPTLNVSSPANNLVTNANSITVSGTTNDATSGSVIITIKVNSVDQGSVTVASNGSFSKAVTLTDGSNSIVITATDAAGKISTVTRTVTLDTSAPVIYSASIAPNPVNTEERVIITVVVV